MLKVWTLILVVTICLTRLHFSKGIQCENFIAGVGSSTHVSISAVCNSDGMVQYDWLRNDIAVKNIQVDYNCSYSNDGENTVNSEPLWTFVREWSTTSFRVTLPRSNASQYSCEVGGCYYHIGRHSTYGIPSATCRYSALSVSVTPTISSIAPTSTSQSSSIGPTYTSQSSSIAPSTILMSTMTLTSSSKLHSIIQPTSTPMERLTNNGLADSTLITIIVAVVTLLLLLVTTLVVTLICITVFIIINRKRSRSQKMSLYLDRQLSNPEPIKVQSPPPLVEEDAKTIVDLLFYDEIIILPFNNSPFPKHTTHSHLLGPESDTSSTTDSDTFIPSDHRTTPDVEAQTDSGSENMQQNEDSLNNDGEDLSPRAASNASIILDSLEESIHGSATNVNSDDHQTMQASNEPIATSFLLNQEQSHQPPNVMSCRNAHFELNNNFFVDADPLALSRQDHTGSSTGYIVMESDTLL